MSQTVVSSRPCSQMTGMKLSDIQHPLSRMSSSKDLYICCGKSGAQKSPMINPDVDSVRPLPYELGNNIGVRKSLGNSGRKGCIVKMTAAANDTVDMQCIPEQVDVKYGDPSSAQLPVFGSRAGVEYDVPPSRNAVSRSSSASSQTQNNLDELEQLLRDKIKSSYHELRKRFKDNDPDGHGNVSREAFLRIIVTAAGRQISIKQNQMLLERFGFKNRTVIPFPDFIAYFRDKPKKDYPKWMDASSKPEKAYMNALEIHSYFVEKARQRFLDLADIIPKVKLEGDVRITKLEFRQMLERMNLYIENSEFEKLWCRYDHANEGIIESKKLLKCLGIEWRNPNVDELEKLHQLNSEKSDQRTPRQKDLERKLQLHVERWLKDKFRECFFKMRQAFESKDPDKIEIVTFDDFLQVLLEFGLKLEKALLGSFLSRCSVSVTAKGVPYHDFLQRFQDRSDVGLVHTMQTKETCGPMQNSLEGESTLKAVQSQLIDMFHRDYLGLLENFKKLDHQSSDSIGQEEFRSAIESRFNFKFTDDQFDNFLDRAPLDTNENVKYLFFMKQFDTKGKVPSLYAPASNTNGTSVSQPELDDVMEKTDSSAKAKKVTHVKTAEKEMLPCRRSVQELFKLIKELLSRRFHEVENTYYELDESNTRRLTQEMMYQLLKKFAIKPEISRGEIRDLWRTFITNADNTLEYLQFIRHFGLSIKSATFPNAKLQPPRRGDADYMIRSKKLNCASDMLQDSLRSKIDFLWDELREEFMAMDPCNTGTVSLDEFREVLIQLCVSLSDTELETVTSKFTTRNDGRISYVEFLKPFALRKQTCRHGNNMLYLLQHNQNDIQLNDFIDRQQKGLDGITFKLRQKLAGNWKNVQHAFRKLDVKGSGYLSLPEFKSVLQLARIILNEEEVYHVMCEFDKELTGKIQYERFIDKTFKTNIQPPVNCSITNEE